MSFEVVAASYKERSKERSALQHTLIAGLAMGGVAVFICSVGITKMFHER